MPRTAGVSSSSRLRCILLSPNPFSVASWSRVRPIGLPIWVTFSFFAAAMDLLPRLGAAGFAPADEVADLLAPACRDGARAGNPREGVEGRLDHVVRVGGAHRLGDDVLDAEGLEDGTHRAAGDDARALR